MIEQSNSARIAMLDSMNLWINMAQPELLDVMKTVDMVIINDGEVKMLANSENLLEACDIVQEMTGVKFLIVKKGEHGVLALHDSQLISLPAFPTRNLMRSSTGCGRHLCWNTSIEACFWRRRCQSGRIKRSACSCECYCFIYTRIFQRGQISKFRKR